VNGIDPLGKETLIELMIVVAIITFLAVSLTGCSGKPTPKVTSVTAVTNRSQIPAYAANIDWQDANIAGDAKLGDVGPYNDRNSNGCVNNVHWFIFEGTGLDSVTVERYLSGIHAFGDGTVDQKFQGWNGPGFKLPSNLDKTSSAFDGPGDWEIRRLEKGKVLIVADAPGLTDMVKNGNPYPAQVAGNALLQVKSGGKILAEVWYDVGIKASAPGPNNVQMNAMKVTESKCY